MANFFVNIAEPACEACSQLARSSGVGACDGEDEGDVFGAAGRAPEVEQPGGRGRISR